LVTTIQFADEITVENPREAVSVRWMARLFFATFWAIIFTGAIRKWIFPGITALYLLQDVPLVLAYIYALWTGLFSRGYLMLYTVLLGTVISLQALGQIIFVGLNVVVAGVGLHNYLFYLPILLIFPLCLTPRYRKSFVWWNLIFSIPMCLLAIAQAESPKQAFINRTSEGDAFGIPGAEIARVSGTFNFTLFYGIWVALAVALCMGEWLLPKERRAIRNQWLLILCTVTVNICHMVSASRSAIALAGAGIFGALVGAVVLRSTRALLALGSICAMLPVAVGMTYLISPAEFNIVVDRFTGDQYATDNKTRVGDSLVGFLIYPKFSLIGAGIGMGVDAAHVGSVDAYNFTYGLSEFDMIRTVMELGTPVGLLYALSRIGFLFGMVFLSIRIVRSGSSPHVLPLSFFVLAQGYTGDLTRNATMTGSQVMIGCAFILGAYYYPDNISLETTEGISLTRSV